jgi:hypothetical protein
MKILQKAKHCTSRIPCRFKLAMITFSAAIVVSAVAVPIIAEMA